MLRKLAGQTAVYGLSTIGVRLLNYLLTPYLTQIMSREVYGMVTDIYSLIPLLLVLLTMGLETGFFRFFGKTGNPAERREVFRTAWGPVCISALVFLAAVLIWNRPLAEVMMFSGNPSFVWLMGLIVVLDVVTAVPFAKLRAEERAMRFVGIRFVQVVVNIVLCVFFYSVLPRIGALSAWWNPEFGAGYFLVANLVASAVALPLLYPAYKKCGPKIDWKRLKPILLYSLPLLVAAVPGVANEFIDRQFVKYMLPPEIAHASLGVYGAVTKLAVVMTLFVQMYRYAAEPFFLSDFKGGEFRRANAEAMKYFVAISVLIFLGITFFSDLFALLIGSDFREGMYILPVVLAANVLAGIVLNLSFWYKYSGMTRFAVAVTGSGFIVTVLLNLVLIPRMGYLGAAWARLGCEFVMVVVSYLLCRRYFPIPYDLRRIGLYFLVGAVLYVAGITCNEYLLRAVSMPLNAILIGLFCIFVLRTEKIDAKAMIRSFFRR